MKGERNVSTERQIRANRVNAKHSTGPRTTGGKQRVGSNALKHGLTGSRLFCLMIAGFYVAAMIERALNYRQVRGLRWHSRHA